jgi:cytochrome P450 RapN
MTARPEAITRYPFVEDDGLDVDPIYKDLQRHGAIKVQLPFGEPCWLATRYDDVRTVFSDRRFSRRTPTGAVAPGVWAGAGNIDSTFPLGMDAPEHTRLRRVTAPVFSPRTIRDQAARIQQLVDTLLNRIVEEGPPADFVAMFSWDLPINVLTDMLGVPRSDADSFRGWAEATTAFETGEAERAAVHRHLVDYIAALIAERRSRRHDDLLALLVNARDEGERLSEVELQGLVMSLIVGGFETTATQLGSTLYALMTHRAHWQELIDGRAALQPALEELWRWIPSFRYGTPFVRWATREIELSGGVLVPAGDAVLPEQSVANRDESAYPDGWELDFHRVDPLPHLALGFGEHLCMGIHLAKLQVQITVATLIRRLPRLELAISAHEVPWPTWTFMRSVGTVPLVW